MPKVLVIDDDPTTRLILKRALQEQAHEVLLAENGEEGLSLARQVRPNLIICDWMMPKLDGLEVCRLIKADAELSSTFFILLTARGALEDRIQGLDTGADDFLAKPIEIPELQARIRAGLRLHQLTEDLQAQKQVLEAELAEASGYVKSLLPAAIMMNGVKLESRFLPSRQLGGDCFDYFWLDPDYLVMFLLDVSGHGLSAALPSISILNLLRSQSLPEVNFYQPHDVLRGLNETFQMTNQNDKYFTMWYGVYNHQRRQLTFASAGHPPALLVYDQPNNGRTVKLLKTGGLPVGMFADSKFSSDRCDIPPRSKLYIYSDGLYGIHPGQPNEWNLSDFINLVTQETTCLELDSILHNVQQAVGLASFDDDLSLLQIDFA